MFGFCHTRVILPFLVALGVTVSQASGQEGLRPVPHPLSVRVYDTDDLGTSDAAIAAAEMSLIAREKDRPDDIACAVAFNIKDDVSSFKHHYQKDSIDVEGDLNRLFRGSGDIYILNTINYCCGPTPWPIVACADTDGIAVTPVGGTDRPILWLHEYLHYQGIFCHMSEKKYVRNRAVYSESRSLILDECNILVDDERNQPRTDPCTITCPSLKALEISANEFTRSDAGAIDPEKLGRAIDNLAHARWALVPYREILALGPTSIEPLLQKVQDPTIMESHANSIFMIGLLASEFTERIKDENKEFIFRILKNYLLRYANFDGIKIQSNGKWIPDVYAAKIQIPTALGLMINGGTEKIRNELDNRIVTFLEEGAIPFNWLERMRWPDKVNKEYQINMANSLSIRSMYGLGLSGKIKSERILQGFKHRILSINLYRDWADPNYGSLFWTSEDFNRSLDLALELYDEIKGEDGLAGYYD